MLTKARKEEIVETLKADIQAARALFVTNLIGIPASDAVEIRKNIKNAKGKIVVTRNTLFARAGKGTTAEKILSNLKGPHAVAFAFEDAPTVAKCLKNAGKDHEVVEFKGGVLGEEVLSVQQIVELADLPSREEMLGTLLATFMAPVSAFARTLNALKDECEKQNVNTPGELTSESSSGEEKQTENKE